MVKNLENEVELLPYDDFRTGFTFSAVYQELKIEQKKAHEFEGRRMFITRHTVLGRWHQIKKEMYSNYRKQMRNNRESNGERYGVNGNRKRKPK